ncbi:hypothetical protein Tco_0503053 [Tanacetum coccineum]
MLRQRGGGRDGSLVLFLAGRSALLWVLMVGGWPGSLPHIKLISRDSAALEAGPPIRWWTKWTYTINGLMTSAALCYHSTVAPSLDATAQLDGDCVEDYCSIIT